VKAPLRVGRIAILLYWVEFTIGREIPPERVSSCRSERGLSAAYEQ
jgi:hypothetical protein